MLINFNDLLILSSKVKGIIHIGAHNLEELPEYLKGKGYTTIVLYGHSVGGIIATAYLNYYQHKFTKPIAFTRLVLNNPLLTTNYTLLTSVTLAK